MARTMLILGEPGTGKSTSLRSLDPQSTFIIKPNTKDLPFPGSRENYKEIDANGVGNVVSTSNFAAIREYIVQIANGAPHIKTVVLEDFSHFITTRVNSSSFVTDTGYAKWNQLGGAILDNVIAGLETLREDLMIIIIHHSQLKDDGSIKEFSAGKLMDNSIKMNSWYTTILHSRVITENDMIRYVFQTNIEGSYLAKSPPGMFPSVFVPNNLGPILKQMDDFYAGKSEIPVTFIE